MLPPPSAESVAAEAAAHRLREAAAQLGLTGASPEAVRAARANAAHANARATALAVGARTPSTVNLKFFTVPNSHPPQTSIPSHKLPSQVRTHYLYRSTRSGTWALTTSLEKAAKHKGFVQSTNAASSPVGLAFKVTAR